MGWVIDLDGVMWLAHEPIAGSAEAVDALLAAGEDVVFVTNNSSSPVVAVEERLVAQGVAARGRVLTSAMAGARLVEPGERALVCAGPGVVEALGERGVEMVVEPEGVDVVVVGLTRDLSYDLLSRATLAVRAGARLVATNDDATYPTPSGQLPGGGAILAALVTATGAAPVVAGKPHPPMVDLVRERLGADGVVVGDRPDTDGRIARALGFEFALVLTGVTGAGDLPVDPAPDVVADDLAAVVDQMVRR
ncbi:HAD-IIA family hydrolase [Actinomarinicola tropica]|uniref:HAD-IIA family hydrolase n=1 Tax=Actinomarinicola tropica TaxID=2789776 RepID=A0A5Q2REI4_9ACTN|nr:HAD-IIA family hydrolase [Actinomarinicola tropica]QGG95219.1 HAD-IIA family hydrolase [Actinomarinicola tropica]